MRHFIHRSAWKGNSRQLISKILNRAPSQSHKGLAPRRIHELRDSYIMWCWIDMRDREYSTATTTPTSFVPWPTPEASSQARIDGHECTATGLVRTGTQWTKRSLQIIENRLNKRNSRTQWDGLERVQANS